MAKNIGGSLSIDDKDSLKISKILFLSQAEERQLNAYVDCVPKHHPMHGHVKDAVLELNRNPFWRQDQKIEFMEHELNTARIMTDVIWGKYRPREEVEQLLQELEEGEEGFHDSVDQDQIDQERSSIEA